MKTTILRLLGAVCLVGSLPAAINPANFQRIASDHVRVKQIARLVHETMVGENRLRRITIVGVVQEKEEARNLKAGDTLLIDYTVNLTALESDLADHEKTNGTMPGRQFMSEPEPPQPDEQGRFWAHLAKAGGRLGNVNRHAGAVVGIGDYEIEGNVFVPAAGQYSFLRPM
ncbi:MAG: hypothetical protein PSU94_06190 [Lacunisphaera sp.]|nr:hypothetical protein [Lacunisphaera sp.]